MHTLAPSAALREETLILFSKAPVAGQVKTRLAASIGNEAAADCQAAFLEDLGRRFGQLDGSKVVACAPGVDHPAFEDMASWGWIRWAQPAGDLGRRLLQTTRRAFSCGARRVVCLGSDSPTLPVHLVEAAFERLRTHDVVIGPVFDGGYYLVGLSSPTDPLFTGIPWGTSGVFRASIHCLESSGHSYAVLPFWYDVDDLLALEGLSAHLGLAGPYGPIEAAATSVWLNTAQPFEHTLDAGGNEE